MHTLDFSSFSLLFDPSKEFPLLFYSLHSCIQVFSAHRMEHWTLLDLKRPHILMLELYYLFLLPSFPPSSRFLLPLFFLPLVFFSLFSSVLPFFLPSFPLFSISSPSPSLAPSLPHFTTSPLLLFSRIWVCMLRSILSAAASSLTRGGLATQTCTYVMNWAWVRLHELR